MPTPSQYLRARVIAGSGDHCLLCGAGPLHRRALCLSPRVPLREGGTATPDNMLVTCRTCADAYARASDLATYISVRRAHMTRALAALDALAARYTTRITPKPAKPKPVQPAPVEAEEDDWGDIVAKVETPAPAKPKPAVVEPDDEDDGVWTEWNADSAPIPDIVNADEYSGIYIADAAPAPELSADALTAAWEE
jgi:hypothetical protein